MNPDEKPTPDDLLARAAAALRDAPIPDGPDGEAMEKALAALLAADLTHQSRSRRRLMIALSKIAAALALAVAGGYYVAAPRPAAANTFAEMAAKLREARTLTYRITTSAPGIKDPIRVTIYSKGADRSRSEAEGGGLITIVDLTGRKTLMLDPKSKTAMILEDKGPKPPAADGDAVTTLAARIRSLEKSDGTPIGERRIGDVATRGFRVAMGPRQEMTFWVDPATDLPVLVESDARIGEQFARVTLSDFTLDRELDDDLFRIEAPEGYTVRTAASDTLSDAEVKTAEEAAARFLKVYVEKSGGEFPPKLDDVTVFQKYLQEPKAAAGPFPDPEVLRIVTVATRFQLAAREIHGRYTYKPEGAKFGDAGRVVFWYKPEGSKTYRAVFADLHIGDAGEDQLPR